MCNNIGAPFFYQNQQREPNNWIRVRVVHRYVKGALITDKTMPYMAQNGRALNIHMIKHRIRIKVTRWSAKFESEQTAF